MPSLHVNDARIHYSDQGRGDPVILVHNGISSGSQWRAMSAHLEDSWRLLAIDLYDRGGSDPWPGHRAQSLDDDAALVTALADEVGPAHLVGHSYGGAVAVRAALAAAPAFSSLVLIEPQLYPLLVEGGEDDLLADKQALSEGFMDPIEEGRQAEGWQFFVDHFNGAGTWQNLPEAKRQEFLAMSASARGKYDAMYASSTRSADLGRISLPTQVLWGGETAAYDIRMCEIVLQNVPGSLGEVIPGTGHMSPLSHPEAVAAALRRHLERVRGQA
jgi:pimeloyl-ACP methyl ester carboxylesterase